MSAFDDCETESGSRSRWRASQYPVSEGCEFYVSPNKVVGCRCGSRNVEGCWGFSNFQISISNCQIFMLYSKISFFQFFIVYRCLVCMFPSFILVSPKKKNLGIPGNQKVRCADFPTFSEFQILRYEKQYFSRMPPKFSCIGSSIFMINAGSEGP